MWPGRDLERRSEREEMQRVIKEAYCATWTSSCNVEIDGLCQRPTIQGHIIPEARLRIISPNGRVIVAEPRPLDISETGQRTARDTFRPVRTSVATTDFFSCQPHDQNVFNIVEQSEINWITERERLWEKLAICAYKAVLPAYVRQDRNARLYEYMAKNVNRGISKPLLESVNMMAQSERGRANRSKWVKGSLEDMIRNRRFRDMTHIITHTGPMPLVAANAYFLRSHALWDNFAGEYVRARAPQFITAYPASYGQIVIRSWITPDHPGLKVNILDPKEAENRHKEAVAASALLIQESEVIAISPRAWEKYGQAKRETIEEHFRKTVPYSRYPIPTAIELPEPYLINMFNTTPLTTR